MVLGTENDQYEEAKILIRQDNIVKQLGNCHVEKQLNLLCVAQKVNCIPKDRSFKETQRIF